MTETGKQRSLDDFMEVNDKSKATKRNKAPNVSPQRRQGGKRTKLGAKWKTNSNNANIPDNSKEKQVTNGGRPSYATIASTTTTTPAPSTPTRRSYADAIRETTGSKTNLPDQTPKQSNSSSAKKTKDALYKRTVRSVTEEKTKPLKDKKKDTPTIVESSDSEASISAEESVEELLTEAVEERKDDSDSESEKEFEWEQSEDSSQSSKSSNNDDDSSMDEDSESTTTTRTGKGGVRKNLFKDDDKAPHQAKGNEANSNEKQDKEPEKHDEQVSGEDKTMTQGTCMIGNSNGDKPVYVDVHLNVKSAPKNSDIVQVNNIAITTCKSFMKKLQDVEPTFKLYLWDPEAENQAILHNLDNFPDNISDLKGFFKGVRPMNKGGKLYMKILVGVKHGMENLISQVNWHFKERQEMVRVAAVQAPNVSVVGWLLYSTKYMHIPTLAQTLSDKCKHAQISLRWIRIKDGSNYSPEKDYSKEPRALHVECSTPQANLVTNTLRLIYRTEAKTFPLHIRMRFVPQIDNLFNLGSITKFQELRNRQAGWSIQCQARTTYDLNVIDKTAQNNKTLRDMIMALPSKTGNTTTPLFTSIDLPWKGSGYTIQFHPDKAMEASMMIKGLFTRLVAEYGEENIKGYFSPEAIIAARDMKWDQATQSITSSNDTEVDEIAKADQDMEFGISVPEATGTEISSMTGAEPTSETFQKERTGDNDSVSTFGGRITVNHQHEPQSTRRADTTNHNHKSRSGDASVTSTGSNVSNTSSLTNGSVKSRMSYMESTVDKLGQMMQQVMAAQNQLLTQVHNNNLRVNSPSVRESSTTGDPLNRTRGNS